MQEIRFDETCSDGSYLDLTVVKNYLGYFDFYVKGVFVLALEENQITRINEWMNNTK